MIKNQIDYIMVDKRYRNGVRNSKSYPGADCGSDHNPVIAMLKIRMKKVRKNKTSAKWNTENIKITQERYEYQMKLDKQLKDKRVGELDEIEEIWKKLKEGIESVAEEICGKETVKKKQGWMNSHILKEMEERRKCKNIKTEEGQKRYKELKHKIQKLCREAKDNYFNEKCKEVEELDKRHNQLLYKKIKKLQPRNSRVLQVIKNKEGKSLLGKEEILKRWEEYVEELYEDKCRGDAGMGDLVNEVYTISSDEISTVIKALPKEKACGKDNISAELLQCMGEEGLEIMTKLINKIYKSGIIPEDFRNSIFVPIPKVSKAQDCSDYRTIALISHASITSNKEKNHTSGGEISWRESDGFQERKRNEKCNISTQTD